MKTRSALAALLCFLTFGFTTARAFDDLPEYGTVEELKDLRKVYVGAEDPDSRSLLLSILKKYKGIEIVDFPDAAELFLIYEVKASTESRGLQRSHYQRSTLTAYVLKEANRKRILWSENETYEQGAYGMPLSAPNEYNLAKHFVKIMQKLRGEKK